jgi:hypothetical protein
MFCSLIETLINHHIWLTLMRGLTLKITSFMYHHNPRKIAVVIILRPLKQVALSQQVAIVLNSKFHFCHFGMKELCLRIFFHCKTHNKWFCASPFSHIISSYSLLGENN